VSVTNLLRNFFCFSLLGESPCDSICAEIRARRASFGADWPGGDLRATDRRSEGHVQVRVALHRAGKVHGQNEHKELWTFGHHLGRGKNELAIILQSIVNLLIFLVSCKSMTKLSNLTNSSNI